MSLLLEAYAEPHRHYHTLKHVRDSLAVLDSMPNLDRDDAKLLEQAIVWHDVAYDPRALDNEERSAALARENLGPPIFSQAQVDEIARLILLTKGRISAQDDRRGAIMISIDLAILGAPRPVYDAYAAAIRREYPHIPEPAYRRLRTKVLGRLLEASPLYPDPILRARLEIGARANIMREALYLSGQDPVGLRDRTEADEGRRRGSRDGGIGAPAGMGQP
jgi:predicted metal-dependent HD superfamily phosphohydrolase